MSSANPRPSEPISQLSEHPPGFKSFTGCWTCRRRRVKCDECRPICRRCENGNFKCDGYEIRLTWPQQSSSTKTNTDADSATTSSVYSQRCSIRTSESLQSVFTQEITTAQDDAHNVQSKAPFSVFSVRDRHAAKEVAPELYVRNLKKMLQRNDSNIGSIPQGIKPVFIAYHPKPTGHDTSRLDAEKLDGKTQSCPQRDIDIGSSSMRADNSSRTADPGKITSHQRSQFRRDRQRVSRTDSGSHPKTRQVAPMLSRALRQVDLFSCQSELLQFWKTSIYLHASPTDSFPRRSQQLVIQISQCNEAEMATIDRSTRALVHANYGIAAAILGNLKDEPGIYPRIASLHHHAALSLVLGSVSGSDQNNIGSQDMLLGAMMLILQLDRYCSFTGGWQAHVIGGINYILKSIADGKVNFLDSTNVNVWLLTLALSNLGKHFKIVQLRDIWRLKPWSDYFRQLYLIDPWLIEVLLEAQTTKIFDVGTAQVLSCQIRQYITDLESERNLDEGSDLARQHQAIILACSVLIYISRSLQQVDPTTIQGLVERVIDDLESLGRPTELIRLEPLLWAYTVAGMESLEEQTQQRYVLLASEPSPLAFTAFSGALQMLRTFWKVRQEQQLGSTIVWHEFLEKMQRNAT